MLKSFIAEYKQTYEANFDEGFIGEFDRFYRLLTEPKLHPSNSLIAKLNSLNSLNYEPMSIAVVGQFSSGKSSFLNAILGEDILPTGVVPVTAKPTFIKYAPNLMLKASFNDGREEYHDIKELRAFVDQRVSLKDVAYLCIYSPNELLKSVSFIDTPGLNSRSDADTMQTKQILKEVGALIWISLIDNAARKSELDELCLIPSSIFSICLLNQKDKLSDLEVKNVLEHAKTTYGSYFSDILAISAKLHRAKNVDSGFDGVFGFIDKIASQKQNYIKGECNKILASSIAQNNKFISILDELSDIFKEFSDMYESKFNQLTKDYSVRFKLLFEQIKQNAALVSGEINLGLTSEVKSYFRPKKSIFTKEIFEKIEYERINLNGDDVLSKLLYNDDKMSKIFKNLRLEFNDFEMRIIKDLNETFEWLKDRVFIFKAKYESLRKSDELHSDVLFADIRKFSSEVYALFLSQFQNSLFEQLAKLKLFFEKINIKITTNYENAIKLSVAFIQEKIQKASRDYESDPLAFALYYPSLEDINQRVLGSLSYYEFESDFVGSSPFILKFMSELSRSFAQIKDSNLNYILTLKNKYVAQIDELKSANLMS